VEILCFGFTETIKPLLYLHSSLSTFHSAVKRGFMKKLLLLCFLSLIAMPCFGADKYAALIESAENSFAAGDYGKTIEIYESLIQVEKIRNPYLHYNLSNAYYRNGELGKAVVNIEKAFLLKPRDADIKHNRRFLHDKAGIAEPEGFNALSGKLTGFCSLNAATVLFSAAVIFILLAASVRLLGIKKAPKHLMPALIFLFVVSGAVFALKVNDEIFTVKAVSLSDSAVRSGPGINNPEIFSLPRARSVIVKNMSGEWSYIKVFPENFSGWVRSGEIEKIIANR